MSSTHGRHLPSGFSLAKLLYITPSIFFTNIYDKFGIRKKMNYNFTLDRKQVLKNIIFCSLVMISVLILMPANTAFAASISWDVGTHYLCDGPVGGAVGNKITVTDAAANLNPAVLDTVNITVKSTSDATGITLTLTETGPNTGIFKNTNIIFIPAGGQVPIGSNKTIEIKDIPANTNPLANDTLPVKVYSTSDITGITVNFPETGINTGIFRDHIAFKTDPSSGHVLHVSAGDEVTIQDTSSGLCSNILITPNSNVGFGAITAKINDTVTATYGSSSATTTIGDDALHGGGGGGVIAAHPGLVLDAILTLLSGGASHVVSPPSFGGGVVHFTDGLTIIQNNTKKIFDISKYTQEIPHQVLVANQPVNMTFKIYENYNPRAIIHSGLFFIPRDKDLLIPNSIASISYQRDSDTEIIDPSNLLRNASATFMTNGTFEYITFHFTPTRSYDKMAFLNRAWNDHLYSTDVRILDAELDQKPVTEVLPEGITRYNDFSDLMTKIEDLGYLKPQIMAHIHHRNEVFGIEQEGNVFWLYNQTGQTVTLKITDKDKNTLYSHTEKLVHESIPIKGDYKFMNFTEQRLNRWDVYAEEKIMDKEAIDAFNLASNYYTGYPFSNDDWKK